MTVTVVKFFLLSLLVSTLEVSVRGWFFSSSSRSEEKQIVTKATVPFELKSVEEHFLQQAGDLSALDKCHHMVIAEIQDTCAGLSEEELGKLSVRLLNCQSLAEGRETFPCTNEMTIAECTRSMDSTTWNAYQIVSNRARSVCYATRQQQFRMKTEYTVNKLVHTTEEQLQVLGEMGKSHEELIDKTTDTLSKVTSGQQELLDQHYSLKRQQQTMHSSVSSTLRDLYKEKALVAAGNKEFAKMTDNLKEKLDCVTAKIVEQDQERKENHKQVVDDLSNIRLQAADVLNKIDTSGKEVEKLQLQNEQYYVDTLENLHKLNSSLSYMLVSIQNLGETLESKINWLLSFMGGTENRLAVLTTVTVHVGYFIAAAVLSSFLNTPMFSRITLLILVPLNAWSEIREFKSLGFLPITLFIAMTTLSNWAFQWLYYTSKLLCTLVLPRKVKKLPPADGAGDRVVTDQALLVASPPGGTGLSQDEYQSLINILEKLRQTGDISVHNETTPRVVDRNVTAVEKSKIDVSTYHVNDDSTSDSEDEIQTERCNAATRIKSENVNLVKRHLLKTLGDLDSTGLLTPSTTPASSTPNKTPPRTPRGSRQSTPNRSVNRPLCLAFTKAGNPCKNSCSEGSAFCHIHQVASNKRDKLL